VPDLSDQHDLFFERGIMMDEVYQYILLVICTVMLCGIVVLIFPEKENTLIKLVTGLAVTGVVLSPLFEQNTWNIEEYFDHFSVDPGVVTSDGEEMARQTSAMFIKEKTEAYVLNKAAEFGADIDVDIMLSDQSLPVPKEITVSGSVSPYVKKQLSTVIERELGIAENVQLWIS